MAASQTLVKSPIRRPVLQKAAVVKEYVLNELRAGRLLPGEALRPEIQLAEEFNLSRKTLRQAMAEMEEEGIIRREQGRGTFVTENAQKQFRKKTGTFSLIVRGKDDGTLLSLIQGFEQACRSARHDMVLCDSENDIYHQADAILRMSHRSDLAGVVILPVCSPSTPEYQVAHFRERNIPVVFCHRAAEGAEGPLLSVDHEAVGCLAGKAFAELGHQRVALMIGGPSYELASKWIQGVRRSLQTVGGELPDEFIYIPDVTTLDHKKQEAELSIALKRILGSENPPTAIFVVDDEFAQAVSMDLQQRGLRIPEDISIMGLGDVDRKGAFLRRLTSVAICGKDLGRQAVDLLVQMQSGKRDRRATEKISIPISIHKGQTLGQAAKSSV